MIETEVTPEPVTSPRRHRPLFPEFRQRAGLLLGPSLFLFCGFALQGQGLPAQASWAAAIVALMSCWWITEPVPLWATALLPLVLFPLLTDAAFFGVLIQYFDPVNFLFLGGMWIAACMEQWGLHRRIALNIIGTIGTSPRRIVLGFMIATAFVTLWISNTAAAMMMFPIGLAVIRKLEEQTDPDDPQLRRFGLALMLGMAYAASIGGIGTKIGTGTNLVFVKNSPMPIDFLTWLKIGLPVVILTIPLVWFYLVRFGARLPAEGFAQGGEAIHEERRRLGRMIPGEIAALVAFLTAATLWIFRKDIDLGSFVIPGWSRLLPWSWNDLLPLDQWSAPIQKLFKEPGDAVVAMVIATALFFIPVSRSPVQFALSPRRAGRIAWGLLILLGGGFAMAHGIQASGLSNTIASSLGNLGGMPPFLLLLVASLVAVALTEVASNTATASILLPILAAGAAGFGVHPIPLMLAVTLASSFGFMLPAGTPPNAVAFSSGYITVPQMARSGLIVDLAGAVLVALLCHFVVPLILNLP